MTRIHRNRSDRRGNSRTVVLLAVSFSALLGAALIVSVAAYWWVQQAPEVWAILRVRRPEIQDNASFDTFRSTQIALLKSPFVINTAIKDHGLAKLSILKEEANPTEWLADQLLVDTVEGSEVIRVSIKHRNTKEALRVVDAVVDSFIEEIVSDNNEQQIRRIEILRDKQRELAMEIDETVAKIGAIESSHGSEQMEEPSRIELEMIRGRRTRIDDALLQTELALAGLDDDDAERHSLESQRRLLAEKLDANSKELAVAFERRTDLQSSVADLQMSRFKLKSLKDLALKLDAEIQDAELKAEEQPQIQVLQRAMSTKG